MRRAVFFALNFDPCVAIAGVYDRIGDVFLVFRDLSVVDATPDQAFHGEYGVCGVGDRLAFCGLTDQALTVGETDDRRRGACTFGVFDNAGLRAVHDCNTGVGRPEVDPDDFGHNTLPLLSAMFWATDPDKASATRSQFGLGLWLILTRTRLLGVYKDGFQALQALECEQNRGFLRF